MLNRVQRYNKYFKYTTIIASQLSEFSIQFSVEKRGLIVIHFLEDSAHECLAYKATSVRHAVSLAESL